MSCAVVSFFRSQVRLDAPDANGTRGSAPKPAPDACTVTSENVTSSAFASVNGLSLSNTLSVESPVGDVDGREPLHAHAATSSAAGMRSLNRMWRTSIQCAAESAPRVVPRERVQFRSLFRLSCKRDFEFVDSPGAPPQLLAQHQPGRGGPAFYAGCFEK